MVKKLFKNHHIWKELKLMITNGSQWPIEELDESRIEDLKGSLGRGNHKSAKTLENFSVTHLSKKLRRDGN